MSWLFHKIRKTQFYGDQWEEWQGDPSEPHPGLKLDDEGNLSVWLVDDDLKNCDRIVAAMAANRTSLQALDYALVAAGTIQGINLAKTDGETPDRFANTHWHRDILKPTRDQLYELACSIHEAVATKAHNSNELRSGRYTPSSLKRLLERGIQQGHIDPQRLKKGVLRKLPGQMPGQ